MRVNTLRLERATRPLRMRLLRLVEPNTATEEPVALVLAVGAVVAIGLVAPHTTTVPYGTVVVPVLVAGLFLRTKSLLVVDLATAAVLIRASIMNGVQLGGSGLRLGVLLVIVITAAFAHVMAASRERLGVQGLRGDAMLAELRDRLTAQGRLPELPGHWHAEVARRSAGGSAFGGDFLVAALSGDGKCLELAVVDVSGKGIDAATRALQLSGALGGILGALPPDQFLATANAYVCRQGWTEGFATAVHVVIDLTTGEYTLGTAGHPRPVQFDAGRGVWKRIEVSGPMLGLIPAAEYVTTTGLMRFGDALMLYTDGMIEVPGRDLEIGIDKLLGAAESLVVYGFVGGANRLIDAVAPDGADDRALVLVTRADR
ncbi:MAG: PP2C family protein-serine/threonine phosphatase [Actinomycetes bacterium]